MCLGTGRDRLVISRVVSVSLFTIFPDLTCARRRVMRALERTDGHKARMCSMSASTGNKSMWRRSMRPCPVWGGCRHSMRGKNRLPKSRCDLFTQVFVVFLYRQQVLTTFLHDPGCNCFLAKIASPVTIIPSRSIISSNRSASGISRPLPQDDLWPTECEARTEGRKNMFGLALRIFAPSQCLAVNRNLARVRIGGCIAGWIDCDLSKHCRHHVGVQNPQCLSQCRMARRLAVPAETQPVEVLARQTATWMKGRFHPFATAEHRKKDQAQYRVQPMQPTLLALRIRDCAQNRTN